MIKRTLILLSLLVLAVDTSAESHMGENAGTFMSQVLAAYRSLSTYRDHGRSVQTLKSNPSDPDDSNITVEFAMLFKRPDKFRYSWTRTENLGDGPYTSEENAIWSDGGKVWELLSGDHVPEQQESFDLAVAGATDATLYAMLSDKVGGFRFDQLHGLKILRSEAIAGADCYVLRGSQHGGWGYDLWVGKLDHLIRKAIQTQPDGNTRTVVHEGIVTNEDIADDDRRFTAKPRR